MSINNWPKNVEAAVELMLARINPETATDFKCIPYNDLSGLHFTLGMAVRNECGLNLGNDVLIQDAQCDCGDLASLVIIEAAWRRLNNIPEPQRTPRRTSFKASFQRCAA